MSRVGVSDRAAPEDAGAAAASTASATPRVILPLVDRLRVQRDGLLELLDDVRAELARTRAELAAVRAELRGGTN